MKILITGGAGFIGSHTAQKYFQEGNEVFVLDNLSTGKKENIPFIKDENFIEADISDFYTVDKIVKENNFDAVIHLAAIVNVVDTVNDPVVSNKINIDSTLNLLESLKLHSPKLKKFVFASSAAVYGNNLKLPNKVGENVNPLSPYALQKYAGEQYTKIYKELYNLPTVSLRFFNVYGPRQDPNSPYSGVLSIMRDKYITKTPFTFYGDGQQTRDFVFVQDIVQAIDLVINTDSTNGKIFNVGTGKSTSLRQIFKLYSNLYGIQIKSYIAEERKGDIKHSFADISDLVKLGYEPKFDVKLGLEYYYNS